MNQRTRVGLSVMAAALMLGVLADAWLRETPWGVNLLLWITTGVVMGVILVRTHRIPLLGEGVWLTPVAILLAMGVTFRDSPTLMWSCFMGLLCTLSLIAWRGAAGAIRRAGVMEYFRGTTISGFFLWVGFPLLLTDIRWKSISRRGVSGHAWAIGRGFLMAVPLLLVFGGLLMAADAVFEDLVVSILKADLAELVTHLFFVSACTWIVAGYFRGLLMSQEVKICTGSRPSLLSLGMVELGTILGLVDFLFLSFVIVQVRYLFGGSELVEVTKGLTYAEYARAGFFELMWVSALALPLLLASEWLLRKDETRHVRVFRIIAGIQVILVYIIMFSAFQRMQIYQREYGLTELRFYSTAFMGWLAVVFAWFSMTVLLGQRERFAFGAMVAGMILLGGLHLFNPDAFILRTNLARAHHGRDFDSQYSLSLSADAVPALIEALPSLPPPDRCQVARQIIEKWGPSSMQDWKTWNWSRSRARRSVIENSTLLRSMESQTSHYPY